MFQVICIATGEPVVVYAVSGFLFLFWKDDTAAQHWEWAPMDQFRPVTAEDRMRGRV